MNVVVPPPARTLTEVQPPPQGGFDLQGLLSTILRRLHIVIALPIVVAAMGYGLTQMMTPRYTSQAQLLIEPRRTNSMGAESEFAGLMVDHTRVASVLSILESTMLLQRVVRDQNLTADPDFAARAPSIIERLAVWLPFIPVSPPAPETGAVLEQRAVSRLREAIRVVRLGMTYVIRIDASASSRAKAQRLSQAVAEAYLTDQLESKFEAARVASVWTTNRLAELRDELLRSEREVERIRRDYNLIEVDRGVASNVGRQQITEINQRLLEAEGDLQQRSARLEQAQRVLRGNGSIESLPDVVGSSVIGTLRGQQADVSRRVADLQQRFGPRHPEYLRADEERRAIASQIGNEVSRILQNLRNEFETAQRRRDSIREQLRGVTAEDGGAVDSRGVVLLREAERVAQANRQLYDGLLQQAREREQQQSQQQSEGRIISPAFLPGMPSFPTPLVFIILPALVATILGLALAFVLAMLESTFATQNELETATGMPALASVPLLTRTALNAGGSRLDIIEYTTQRQLSRFSEALRTIRTGLQMSNVDSPPKIIQVTSAVPAEGKSTLAAALAISAANAGLRTVLVDADFRHPSVSQLFGIRSNQGLVDVLLGTSTVEEVMVNHKDTLLRIMAAGTVKRSPPDLIASNKFRTLFEDLAKDADLVIIDSPPVLVVSDAKLISGVANTSILVVEWRETPRDVVQQALSALRQVGGNVAGLVLNKVDYRKMARYGYGYGYGYSHRGYGRYYRSTNKYYRN